LQPSTARLRPHTSSPFSLRTATMLCREHHAPNFTTESLYIFFNFCHRYPLTKEDLLRSVKVIP
jgi:hypothetical protein